MARIRTRRKYALAAAVAAITVTGGCSTQAPCLQYEPQTHTRVISLRGHGAVQISEEALVCSLRAQDADRLLDASSVVRRARRPSSREPAVARRRGAALPARPSSQLFRTRLPMELGEQRR